MMIDCVEFCKTLGDETRQRILEVARRLNYYPNAAARTLVSGRTETVDFVLCQSPDRIYTDAFLPEVLRGMIGAPEAEMVRAGQVQTAHPFFDAQKSKLGKEDL